MTARVILRAVNVLRTPFRDRSVIVAHRAVESVALKRQSPLKRRIYSQKEAMRSAHRRSCPVLSVLPSGGDVWRKRIRAAANYRGFPQASPVDAGRKVERYQALPCLRQPRAKGREAMGSRGQLRESPTFPVMSVLLGHCGRARRRAGVGLGQAPEPQSYPPPSWSVVQAVLACNLVREGSSRVP
jgi:hypothetical protein